MPPRTRRVTAAISARLNCHVPDQMTRGFPSRLKAGFRPNRCRKYRRSVSTRLAGSGSRWKLSPS